MQIFGFSPLRSEINLNNFWLESNSPIYKFLEVSLPQFRKDRDGCISWFENISLDISMAKKLINSILLLLDFLSVFSFYLAL